MRSLSLIHAQSLRGRMIVIPVAALLLTISGHAQYVSITCKHDSLNKALAVVAKQSDKNYFVPDNLIADAGPVTLHLVHVSLDAALDTLLHPEGLKWWVTGRTIHIARDTARWRAPFRGCVVDDQYEPLKAATIIMLPGGGVNITNGNGQFGFAYAILGARIRISYTGCQPQDFLLRKTNDTFVLKRSNSSLDAATVIAYGETTKRFSTANLSSVDGLVIEQQPLNNPLEAMEGRVPGLYLTETNGLRGSMAIVRIQGQNSIVNGNDPLYVIDGVPYSAELPAGTTIGGAAGPPSPLNFLNPNDIANITVLKDADATAIYGARAANGVILITTKKGKPGDAQMLIDYQQGGGRETRELSLLDPAQYLEMRHEALKNDQTKPGPADHDLNGDWDTTRYTNWQQSLLGGTAQYTNVNAGVSGGSANTQYLVSGTYNREGAVLPGAFNDTKTGVHISLGSAPANRRFSFQVTASYLADDNSQPQHDPSGLALSLPPVAPAPYNRDGSLNWQPHGGLATWENPFADLLRRYDIKADNLLGNAVLTYKPARDLELKTNLGYVVTHTNELSTTPFAASDPATQTALGTLARTAFYAYNTIESWIVEPQLDYSLKLGPGKLVLLLGSTFLRNTTNGLLLGATGFNSDEQLADPYAAANLSSRGSVQSVYKYAGAFGRLNYNWRNKWLINGALRRDGSSRFGPANEYHNFASIGAGWIFSEERVVRRWLSPLSFGKVWASYGTTGNDQIGDYRSSSNYTPVNEGVPYQNITGLAATNLPNPNLQWEETRKLQGGVDLGLFGDKLLLSATLVRNRSSNELISVAMPYITGFGAASENEPALVQNTESELEATATLVKRRNFHWNSGFNLTVPHNKLLKYYGDLPSYLLIGKPLNSTRVYQFAGVDPDAGVYQFRDATGKLTIAPNPLTDQTGLINTAFPVWYGGLDNEVGYKSFTLKVFFQFVKAMAANEKFGQNPPPGTPYNQPAYVLRRWQKPGDITDVERFNANYSLSNSLLYAQQSNAYYSSNAYARLKNLSLSWQAPPGPLRKMRVRELRLYANVQNLLTLTKFHGLDPETGNASVPLLRMVTFGARMGL